MSKAMAIVMLAAATLGPAQTMSLDEAVARAIAHSPELRGLEAAVAEARANAELGDPFRSSASVGATPGYATGLPTAVLGQVPAIGTIEAHRLLYDPAARAEHIAASPVDAATARLQSRKREIAQNAAELFARVNAGRALVAAAQRRVTAYETIAARTEALKREGRARDLDASRTTLQASSAKRSLSQAQTRLSLDQLRLNRMVGGNVVPDPATAQVPRSARNDIEDPELRSLESRIGALRRAVDLDRRFLKPSVAAQIQYSRLFDRFRRYYLNFNPDDFSVGATVTLPLWTGGRRAASSARLAAQLDQLIAQRDARRTEMELAIREAEADVTQAQAESDLAARAHSVAEESLRVAEELEREGRGEVNDVPQAQIALAEADDDVANAGAHVVAARVRLLVVRGELPEDKK